VAPKDNDRFIEQPIVAGRRSHVARRMMSAGNRWRSKQVLPIPKGYTEYPIEVSVLDVTMRC
jgi:hypothetical protein